MKKTIRKGCFETNSSSMHSIVVSTIPEESKIGYFWKNEKDNMISWSEYDLEFGWGFNILTSFMDKAKFAVASFAGNDNKIEEILNIVYEKTGCHVRLPMAKYEHYKIGNKEYDWYNFKWLKDKNGDEYPVLKSEYNNPNITNYTKVEYYEKEALDAQIDHQSDGLLKGFLEKTNVSIRDFLTEAKYIVIIDNDNSCHMEGVLESGIWDTSKVVMQYPKDGSYDSLLWEEENNEEND